MSNRKQAFAQPQSNPATKFIEWKSNDKAFEYYDKELIADICNKFEVDEDEAEDIFEEFRDEITDHYYNVDDSDVLKDLVRNSRPINVRIPLYSNYDCINSHYFEGGYAYKESYFGDMVDVLNLNPAKVKKMLLENDVKCYGSFPNYKHRDGKEFVSYAFDHFSSELFDQLSNIKTPPEIRVSELKENAALLGAAAEVYDTILNGHKL